MTLRALLLVVMGAVLLLSGCASKPVLQDTGIPWSAEQAAGLNRFVIRGKVGFRRGETGGSAALTWQQDADRYRLAANGPLGQGATRISGNADSVRIENSSGSQESAQPEALLAEALGWPVSINSLAWWVRGVAAPGGDASVDADSTGRPLRIRQQGWDIALDRWRTDAGGRQLPHRVIASGGDSRVTLLIERWEFPPAGKGLRATPVVPAEAPPAVVPAAVPAAAAPEAAIPATP